MAKKVDLQCKWGHRESSTCGTISSAPDLCRIGDLCIQLTKFYKIAGKGRQKRSAQKRTADQRGASIRSVSPQSERRHLLNGRNELGSSIDARFAGIRHKKRAVIQNNGRREGQQGAKTHLKAMYALADVDSNELQVIHSYYDQVSKFGKDHSGSRSDKKPG